MALDLALGLVIPLVLVLVVTTVPSLDPTSILATGADRLVARGLGSSRWIVVVVARGPDTSILLPRSQLRLVGVAVGSLL